MNSINKFILGFGLFLPGIAAAQPAINVRPPAGAGSVANMTLGQLVSYAVEVAIIVAGIGFVILLLLGGFQYLTSAGNPDGAQRANRTMLNAVIGLVIVVASYAVARYVVVNLFKIQGVFS